MLGPAITRGNYPHTCLRLSIRKDIMNTPKQYDATMPHTDKHRVEPEQVRADAEPVRLPRRVLALLAEWPKRRH